MSDWRKLERKRKESDLSSKKKKKKADVKPGVCFSVKSFKKKRSETNVSFKKRLISRFLNKRIARYFCKFL